MRQGYQAALVLAIAGIADLVAWVGAEIWFNRYCWYTDCPYQTVGLPLNILLATGPLLLLLSAVVAVVSFDAYSTKQPE